jgi:hypothetical protein
MNILELDHMNKITNDINIEKVLFYNKTFCKKF